MPQLSSHPSRGLRGTIRVPGDKSISHRALILGGLATGETTVSGLLEGHDVLATARAMGRFGARVERDDKDLWRISGVGVGGLAEPEDVIDMGNSGTAVRLLMGLAATHPIMTVFTGDDSLRRRPMGRVVRPLGLMGADIQMRGGSRLPAVITGTAEALPISYELPVASAQVKSAILLAGLNAAGRTTVIEPAPTRDHTERMLAHFGATVDIGEADGKRTVSVTGYPELHGQAMSVPGDPSSAAFLAVAALITPDSELTIEGVGLNPLRTGLYETLGEMGADLTITNARDEAGEPVGDLIVRSSALKGVDVPPERAPSMIDEYPILAVAAAAAQGRTRMTGLAELRVKESDRLAAMARGLDACGVKVEELEDGLIVSGGKRVRGGATVTTHLDHRIAMSFLVLGLAAAEAIAIDDDVMIDTSFPGFAGLLNGLGAGLK